MSGLTTETVLAAAVVLLGAPTASNAQSGPPEPSVSSTQAQDHAAHSSGQKASMPAPSGQEDHTDHQLPTDAKPYPAGVLPISAEDRAAAFPKLNGQHAVHDDAVHFYVLFDQLESQADGASTSGSWDNRGWIGRDVNRFWFRSEGESQGSDIAEAQVHALYGRAIHPWWDVVVGLRQDFRPGPGRTWAAVGIQGVAPYWFDVEATAYIGPAGRTHFRVETEYDLLLTNRLIVQPLVELEIYGKSDRERGIGAGLSSGEAGLRLRYELRREFAPYVGVVWHRKFFGTADFAEITGDDRGGAKLALGVRVWF